MTLRRFKERKREDGRKKKGKIREGRKGGTGDEGKEKRKRARKGEGGKERRCALTRYWSHSRFLDLTSLTDK